MDFTISREHFLERANIAAAVVERKQTLPILANVLLVVDSAGSSLTGTDLDTEISIDIEVDQVREGGEITLPGRKLVDILKALPQDALIECRLDGSHIVLKSGRSRFKLATLAAADFPRVEMQGDTTAVAVPAAPLSRAVSKVQFAMAQQDVRYYLNGMHLSVAEGRLRCVATDGHRLALSDVTIEDTAATASLILPRKAVLELAKLLSGAGEKPVALRFSSSHLQVEIAGLSFTSVLIEGRFPDYERVMPKGRQNTLGVDRKLFKEVLGRAAILSNEQFRGVRMVLDGGALTVATQNTEQEEAEETIEAVFDGASSYEIGFNVGYLQDVLGVIESDQVEFQLGDPNGSALMVGKGDMQSQYVVMPMRL